LPCLLKTWSTLFKALEEAYLPPAAKPQSSRVILVCAWLMGFALETPLFCVPPVMHIITDELRLSYAQSGLIFSVPLIILAAIAIPSGALADRIGIRKAAGIGVIVIAAGGLLRGLATDFWTLLLFTCLYGVGLGLVLPSLPKLVGNLFPPQKIGFATGVYTTGIVFGVALSLAITLPLVFPITNSFQGVFYIWSIPAVAAAIMWWVVVREPAPGRRQTEPIAAVKRLSYRIWSNGALWLLAILFFIIDYVIFTSVGWAPQLMMAKGATPALAALMASVMSWVSIPLNFAAPWASDRTGSRKVFLWPSFVLFVLALVGAIYAPLSLGWAVVVVIGLAAGAQFPIIMAFLPDLVPVEGIGRASGMVMSIGYVGGLVGPWLGGYILDITGTLNLNLFILAGLSAVGAYLALRLPETGVRVMPL
jgi:CP family cyanate transporter-like MFS transporter